MQIQETALADIPCTQCLFLDSILARSCNPVECKKLTEWICSEGQKLRNEKNDAERILVLSSI